MTAQRIKRIEIIVRWLRELYMDNGGILNKCSCGRLVRYGTRCGRCEALLIADSQRKSKS